MNISPIPYLSVTQPIGTFYICVMKASLLLSAVEILRRDLTPEGRERVQREYNEEQGTKIADFAVSDDATFPTALIVNVYSRCMRLNEQDRTITLGRSTTNDVVDDENGWEQLTDTEPFFVGEVVDGQHRLLGIKQAIKRYPDLADMEMPVVLMVDLDPENKAYVFLTINSTQRKVNSSLIVDLFGLRKDRSPMKTCHEIAKIFYEWEGGPFVRGLKMLGKKTAGTEMLSQGSFSKYVLGLISTTPKLDEERLEKGEPLFENRRCPLRPYFAANQDPLIARILHEYFRAVKTTFSVEWDLEPEKHLLRKTVGFSALTKAFVAIWDAEKMTDPIKAYEYFLVCAQKFKANLAGKPLTSEAFGSSEKAAKQMADFFTDGTDLRALWEESQKSATHA